MRTLVIEIDMPTHFVPALIENRVIMAAEIVGLQQHALVAGEIRDGRDVVIGKWRFEDK